MLFTLAQIYIINKHHLVAKIQRDVDNFVKVAGNSAKAAHTAAQTGKYLYF